MYWLTEPVSLSHTLYCLHYEDQLSVSDDGHVLLQTRGEGKKQDSVAIAGELTSHVLVRCCKYHTHYLAMFSVFPPFYYGLHNVILGWITLVLLFLMHIFAVVQRCDR
jgi:hypothetical protein